MTTYTVFAVACDDAGGYSGMQVVQFVTEYAGPRPYEWESARDGIPSYTDLVLCYGGSTHRTPFGWNKERFAPFVTLYRRGGRRALAFRQLPLHRVRHGSLLDQPGAEADFRAAGSSGRS